MLYACTASDDENPATSHPRTGDASVVGTGTGTVDGGGTGDPTGAPICAKYGGIAQVNALAAGILNAAKTDCRIATNFTDANQNEKHLQECFQIFVAGGFQCPGVTYVQGTTVDSNKDRCESILPGVKFSATDWKAFADFNVKPASVVAGQLATKGLTADELRALAVVFEGKKATLLDGNVPQGKYTQCTPNCAIGGDACILPPPPDAGKDTGAPPPPVNDGGTDAGDGGP
jgi:hypothetical protein